jgi:hypothetical protein
MSDKGLTTENLEEFKGKQKEGRADVVLKNANISTGEVGGKEVKWNYNEGRQV